MELPRWKAGLVWGWVLAAVVLLSGCGTGNFLNVNDQLRRENMQLTEQVNELRERVDALERRLEIAQRRAAYEPDLPEGVREPQFTRLEIGQFSGGADTDQDPAYDVLRIYVRTLDSRGRFIQVIGEAKLSAVVIRPGEKVLTIATCAYAPQEFDQAYRSGLTGTHYTLLCPIERPVPETVESITVRLAVHDLLTGQTIEAQQRVSWNPATGDKSSQNG